MAEFSRASDAIEAAVSFQYANTAHLAALTDDVKPVVRVGIAIGEVVIADNTVTGEGVVLAQRLEQLAESGGVCLQDAAYQTVPKRLPFNHENLGEQKLKGFAEPVRAYVVRREGEQPVAASQMTSATEPADIGPTEEPSIAGTIVQSRRASAHTDIVSWRCTRLRLIPK